MSGGGKSLESLRLLSKPPQSNADSTEATTSIAAAAPAAAVATPAGASQPTISPGRPKGKNFAAMANAAKARSSPSTNSGAAAPPIQRAPATSSESAPPIQASLGKPKGKDFSAMAYRMGASNAQAAAAVAAATPQPSTPAAISTGSTMNQSAQAVRAAKMQAEARAAAGLPPLETPTAKSVTTTPPPITPSRNTHSQGLSSAASSGLAKPNTATATGYNAAQYPVTGTADARQQHAQQQQHHHHQAMRKNPSHATSVPNSGTRNSIPGQQSTLSRRQAPISGNRQPSGHHHANIGIAQQKPATISRPSVPTPQPLENEAFLSATASAAKPGAPHMAPLIGQRIQDLVKSVDPNYTIDAEAEEQLLQLADDFLDKVTKQSIRLAQHRNSKTLDVQDLQIVLMKLWGIQVPGLGPPTHRKLPSTNSTSSRFSGLARGSGGSLPSGSKRRSSGGDIRVPKKANTGLLSGVATNN